MIGLNIWKAIGDFCTNVAFIPYNFFKGISDSESWWTANLFNVVMFLITAGLFVYWFMQLAKFKKNGTEDYV